MRYEDLPHEEREIVRRLKAARLSERIAILNSQQSFKDWLQTSLSSIWNTISSIFNDVWGWIRSAVIPKGKFHQVWVDHNIEQNGRKGMRIHVKFDVDNVKDVSCRATAYFYFSSGSKLKSKSNSSYNTSNGYVCVGKGFTPTYEGAIYEDFVLFMPYGELNMADGEHSLKFYIALYIEGGDFFADSNWVYFTHTKG